VGPPPAESTSARKRSASSDQRPTPDSQPHREDQAPGRGGCDSPGECENAAGLQRHGHDIDQNDQAQTDLKTQESPHGQASHVHAHHIPDRTGEGNRGMCRGPLQSVQRGEEVAVRVSAGALSGMARAASRFSPESAARKSAGAVTVP